jgi:hypothetical protein
MDYEFAKELLVGAVEGDSALVSTLRMGNHPERSEMTRLIEALKYLNKNGQPTDSIDRELARALHILSFHVEGLVRGWESAGRTWPSWLVDELPKVYLLIDEFFGVLD